MGTRGTRGGTIKHKLPVWTEQSIQRVLNAQYMPRGKYILNNLFVFEWESDYIARTLSGYWYEVEIKVSVADFKNDFTHKEKKHAMLKGRGQIGRTPNYYSFAVPEPMVEKVAPLVPPYAGLISISANGFMSVVKPPVLLHTNKYTDSELRLTDKFYYNYIEYKTKYNDFSKELAKYRAEINNIKAEFKAVTGMSFREHLKDAL